jgi:hypothetical protein
MKISEAFVNKLFEMDISQRLAAAKTGSKNLAALGASAPIIYHTAKGAHTGYKYGGPAGAIIGAGAGAVRSIPKAIKWGAAGAAAGSALGAAGLMHKNDDEDDTEVEETGLSDEGNDIEFGGLKGVGL